MTKQTLARLVEGKSVALVGNSQRIYEQSPAALIDGADVVIRMNRGIPAVISPALIGSKTTVWATAKYWADISPPADCECILWMKLTPLGVRQFKQAKASWSLSICVWPSEYEAECRQFVGADPGTGIRLLWWLKTKANPRAVSVYGMDCWEVPSHWSGRMNTPNHKPDLERVAMLKLL